MINAIVIILMPHDHGSSLFRTQMALQVASGFRRTVILNDSVLTRLVIQNCLALN